MALGAAQRMTGMRQLYECLTTDTGIVGINLGFPCSLGSLSRREIPSNSSGSPATLPVPRLPPIASAVIKDRSRLRHVPIPAPARRTASSILWTGSTPSRPTFRIAAAIACATMGRLPIAHNRRKPSANSKPRRHRTLPHRAKRPLILFNGAGHLGPALSRGFSRWTPLLFSCGAEMKIISFITDPRVVDRILRHQESQECRADFGHYVKRNQEVAEKR